MGCHNDMDVSLASRKGERTMSAFMSFVMLMFLYLLLKDDGK